MAWEYPPLFLENKSHPYCKRQINSIMWEWHQYSCLTWDCHHQYSSVSQECQHQYSFLNWECRHQYSFLTWHCHHQYSSVSQERHHQYSFINSECCQYSFLTWDCHHQHSSVFESHHQHILIENDISIPVFFENVFTNILFLHVIISPLFLLENVNTRCKKVAPCHHPVPLTVRLNLTITIIICNTVLIILIK